MSEYIKLEDDDEDNGGVESDEELTPLDEVFESLKELFEVRDELDDAFESLVNEMLNNFEAKEAAFLSEIEQLKVENKTLQEANTALTQIINRKLGNIQNN